MKFSNFHWAPNYFQVQTVWFRDVYACGHSHAQFPAERRGGGYGLVGPEAAERLQSQLEYLNRNPQKRAYFDFDHEVGAASGWPTRFFWQDGNNPGVY